ncbi:YlcI/YnfO family protein [Paratractidigestivibacter faecalis]|uniref:YlcI/YnfO family protein n=1 Tax=Paratractidigestivibacter faecalis TaxID=2292441 RepID=A0ABV1IH85_9ACTN
MSYLDLLRDNASATEIREHLGGGEQTAITIRIPENLRDAAKEEASLRGMSFSAFVRACVIEELSKKGA